MTARRRRVRPVVWLYALSWNELSVLPFFFRHYDPWIDRYFIYDDGSTDGTLDTLAAHPRVTIRRFTRPVPNSFVESARLWQNHAWKEARGKADFVVLTAVDEHLFHSDIVAFLSRCRREGVGAIPALGFNMLVEAFPPPDIWLAGTYFMGEPHHEMNKLSLFNPDLIEETNFAAGRHYALPTGALNYPPVDELLNLHYKYLGRDYVFTRNAMLRTGLGAHDLRAGLGNQYVRDREAFDQAWDQTATRLIDYRDSAVGFSTHVERWWRGPRMRG
jgi:glycosyltransferase involved in cell wall biosynthesis